MTPRVSIGMPVYNGENYVREAIESVLRQTYEDFELVICNNASSDRTAEICHAYAAGDPRVRYVRNERNIGSAPNFNRVFELSSGEYFKWAGHDDLIAPNYLAACVAVLDRDRTVVLCHSRTLVIDERGRGLEEYAVRLRTDSTRPDVRFLDVVWISHSCFQAYGLIRASALEATNLLGSYAASDRVLLARLALLGQFHEVPECLFMSRRHATRYSQTPRDRLERAEWFDPAKRGRIVFPRWRLLAGYWGTLWHAPVTWRQRARCVGHMTRWTGHNTRRLLKDVTTALKDLAARTRIGRGLLGSARRLLREP